MTISFLLIIFDVLAPSQKINEGKKHSSSEEWEIFLFLEKNSFNHAVLFGNTTTPTSTSATTTTTNNNNNNNYKNNSNNDNNNSKNQLWMFNKTMLLIKDFFLFLI